MSESAFTSSELAVLRQHGIVLFANRVIFDAQPPMKESDIGKVQAVCSGPIPAPLLELWRTTAGGSLDYALTLEMAGNLEEISWTELFYNESSAYHDLQGWIEHELECAEEAHEDQGIPWHGTLDALPFGGFEYCDRVYVAVGLDGDRGQVLAWKMGLPPAWTHRLHKDSVAAIATDLQGAFGALHLPEDPLAPVEKFYAGQSFLDYLSGRVDEHHLDKALADRIIDFYRRAILDWRSHVTGATIAQHPQMALLALSHAIRSDDGELVAHLAALKVPLDKPVGGSAMPVEMALSAARHLATRALIESGAAVTSRCLGDIHDQIPVGLVELLLERGALPDVNAVIACVEYGSAESADLIARTGVAREPDFPQKLGEARRERIQKLNEDLKKVRAGKLSHFLSQEQLKQHVERLLAYRTF